MTNFILTVGEDTVELVTYKQLTEQQIELIKKIGFHVENSIFYMKHSIQEPVFESFEKLFSEKKSKRQIFKEELNAKINSIINI